MCIILTTIMSSISTIHIYASDEVYDVLNEEAHDSFLLNALTYDNTSGAYTNDYDSFLVSYFDNLTYNFGVNYKGSCGYVAIGMILSYYDSYISDNIVPEQYDIASIGNSTDMISRRNSPGSMRDLIANPNNSADYFYARNLSPYDYYAYVTSLQNSSLHSKLISIGASLGYFAFTEEDNPAGTTFGQRLNVLTNYFENNTDLSGDDYAFLYINYQNSPDKSNLVKEFTINQIKAGNPVLLAVAGDDGGHAVIAYDYDEVTGQIFCHMGWGGNTTHVTPESQGFTIYRSALVINFNIDHTHSLNYGVTSIVNNVPTTSYYCYDNCEIVTYTRSNTTLDHNFHYNYYSTNQHEAVCGDCNHSIYLAHEYTYLPYTNLKHKSLCDDCGYYKYEAHVISGSGVGTIKRCLKCYDLIGSGGIQYNSVGDVVYITDNGSYIRPDGIIVLSDVDTELYLSGNLNLDNLVNHNCYTE